MPNNQNQNGQDSLLKRSEVVKQQHPPSQVPRIGVSAIIYNDKNEVLMGERLKSHGANAWQFPGGHLDLGELSFEAAAEREAEEETQLTIKAEKIGPITNDLFWEWADKEMTKKAMLHYVTVYVKCRVVGELDPKTPITASTEEERLKCKEWVWRNPDEVMEKAAQWKDEDWWNGDKQERYVAEQKYYTHGSDHGGFKPFLPIVNLRTKYPGFDLRTFTGY